MNAAMIMGFFCSVGVLLAAAVMIVSSDHDRIVGGSAAHYLFLAGLIGFIGTAPVTLIKLWWTDKDADPQPSEERSE